ncbi:MAG: PKD domain-containing protein [Candidatus Omnitrophica bacterium]|nr:PKD domain-containing protein [Candidatus Omnitrophota bacterium]
MKTKSGTLVVQLLFGVPLVIGLSSSKLHAAEYTLIGWNDLGMHCMDGLDFSVFSLLPPYNTFHAQLIYQGRLLTNSVGYTVTYQGVADPSGSINTTSKDKCNFWQYVQVLYGASPAPDTGLAGFSMPGPANTPQDMSFDTAFSWFSAVGVPLTPYDDALRKNSYPMMRLIAHDSANNVLAATDIVTPVSDEMDCRICHGSGSATAAHPAAGWVWDCDPLRDAKLNILLLHDQKQAGTASYTNALQATGYGPEGLYYSATVRSMPVQCGHCHLDNALSEPGLAGIPPLTQSMHAFHSQVTDPLTGQSMNDSTDRTTCYRCHPGTVTQCLRGVMANAVGPDGTKEIQCQSCHGVLSQVGAANRQGWLDEPNCQACHTGTATSNNGQIRYTSVFDNTGATRVAVNQTFATQPNVPAAGLSLYRFSSGHGGLQCEACHGSTHAIFATSVTNDNIQSVEVQGHIGLLVECTACHTNSPVTVTGGPHGMHPVGQAWVQRHPDVVGEGSGAAQCQVCHGLDYRGTVLSRLQADRTLTAFSSTKNWWRKFQVGCYNCHRGPGEDDQNPNLPPVVSNASTSTSAGVPVSITLSASDPDADPITVRIVSQPAHGTVALSNLVATYFPNPTFVGADAFTFAASDGQIDSNLGTVTANVAQGNCQFTVATRAPASLLTNAPVPFAASVTVTQCAPTITYDWDFGDGSAHGTNAIMCHAYSAPGSYAWTLMVSADTQKQTVGGTIQIELPPSGPAMLSITNASQTAVLTWPLSVGNYGLELAPDLSHWSTSTIAPAVVQDRNVIMLNMNATNQFYRLLQK